MTVDERIELDKKREILRTGLEEYISQNVKSNEKLEEPDRDEINDAMKGLKIAASFIESMAYKFHDLHPEEDDISAMFAIRDQISEHLQKFNELIEYFEGIAPDVILRRIEDNGEFSKKLYALHKEGLHDQIGMELKRRIRIYCGVHG